MAPSTPPATTLAKDAIIDDAKFHDSFLKDLIESILADHGIFQKKEAGGEEKEKELKMHKLNKRAPPDPNPCPENTVWKGTICWAAKGIRAFVNRCEREDEPNENQWGECDEGFQCMDVMDADNELHIECVPIPLDDNTVIEDPKDKDPEKDKKPKKFQIGWRKFLAQFTSKSHTRQNEEKISLLSDMDNASTSARLVDLDLTYVIRPLNEMNANVKGWSQKLCKSHKESNVDDLGRGCKPLGRWNFEHGDELDIQWGMSDFQEGFLFYLISER